MTLQEVLNNNLCVGCGLCQSIFGPEKVLMGYNDEGFLRPNSNVPLSESEEDLFAKICPGVQIQHLNTKRHDIFLGPYRKIDIGYSTDDAIRYNGSSGGVITGLAAFLLEEGKVDCVLQIGPSSKNPVRNTSKLSYNREELIGNAGSRYAPSATLMELKEILLQKNLKRIAVIGKPCDIVGVRNFIRNNAEANKKINYLLSFMCAGLPSINGTLNIINSFGLEEKDVTNLKYRGEGWPGYFKIRDRNNNDYKKSYNESWGNELNRHLQFRCKICPDGTGEFADITCADAWESSEGGYPSFNEKPGQSLIVSRTDVGEQLLQEAVAKKYIILSSSSVSIAAVKKMQPYQVNRKQNLLARLLALKLLRRKTHAYNRRVLFRACLKENPLRLAKNFIGTIKRA